MRLKLAVPILLVIALAATGCDVVKPGSRCRGSGWGESGETVLQCRGGRWTAVSTKAQVVALFIAIAKNRAPDAGQVVRPDTLGSPTIDNAADNFVLVDGSTYYMFSTRNFRRVPVRVLSDIDTPAPANNREYYAQTAEAMPTAVPWASRDEIWAPTVAKLAGRYVMFFASERKNPPDPNNADCVGRAFSDSPAGPYVPEAQPVSCGYDGIHGALDPNVFVGPDGSVTLHLAFGGSPDNIWGISLDAAGNPAAPPKKMLTRMQPWEDWFLENPAMIWDGTNYVLAYSAGRWYSGAYMTGIARCATPTGPCNSSPNGPWLSSLGGRDGPGGLSFFVGTDGQARVVYHTYAGGTTGTRAAHVRKVFFDPWPRLG